MRFRLTLTIILTLAMTLVVAPFGWAQQKLFTQEQVVSMVRDGFGDESGAKLIEQRGIDFAPSEDFLQTIKAAGASEAFLKALRAAQPPEAAVYHRAPELGSVFPLARPTGLLFLVRMQLPESNSNVAGPNDLTQPVRLCLKLRMADETADETRGLVDVHRQANDAVMGMAKRAIEYVHFRAGTSSSWWCIRISRANRTDSAMASWLRAPRQLSMMASQAMPLAT